jgi:hypothetical protein
VEAKIFERNLLLGHWYRGDTDDTGNQLTEFAKMYVDGTFEFTFIQYDKDGHVHEEITEFGDWGLVGDIHFTITQGEHVDGESFSADMENEDNYQAYKVLKLNNKILEYQHIITNEVFILRRVVDKIAHC